MTPLERLRKAIEDEGAVPAMHQRTMRRHRREWPTLWAAIDALLAEGQDKQVERFGSRFPR